MKKISTKVNEILSDPYLIDKVENHKKSFQEFVLKKVPMLGDLLSINLDAMQKTRLTMIEDELDYIQKNLSQLEKRDDTFIESPEFRKFVMDIINQIAQSSDNERRNAYANLLINGISITDDTSNKMMYLNTLNNLTTNHIIVLSFFMNPELFCKNNDAWPANNARSCPKETILREIFTKYDFDIIHQAILDLSRFGIIQQDQTKLNSAIDTLQLRITSSDDMEKSAIIKEVLSRFKCGLTNYGNKFTKYVTLEQI